MPPGGFRQANVNCWDIETGFEVREKLALSFWSTHQFQPNRANPPKLIRASATDLR
jgi:hypothetical protein